ncbi:MAG: hypothetical protein AAB710_00320, partial [Patescibacteria group bacterium]
MFCFSRKYLILFLISVGFFLSLFYPARAEKSSLFGRYASLPYLQELKGSLISSAEYIQNYFQPALQTLQGTSRIEQKATADLRSSINKLLSFSLFGDSFRGRTLSPEEALRIRQQNSASGEDALPFSTEEAELNVNAESLFKEQTKFRKDILLQGDLFADGRRVELGAGTLTASNVLYSIVGGDGIVISGFSQRPTISATQQFWQLNDTVLSPQLTDAAVSIPGELRLDDILRFSNDASLFFESSALLLFDDAARLELADNLANALSISTSTNAMPLISLSSLNRGNISFGTSSSQAFVSVMGSGTENRLWVGSNDTTDFLVDEFGNIGIGTDNPSAKLSVLGSLSVSDTATFQTAPRFASILDCVGDGA